MIKEEKNCMSKVWFITGSSRGFGRAITETVLAAGDRVIATARRPEQLDDFVKRYGSQVFAVKLDVTVPTEAQNAVSAAIDKFGRIDVLVNNAGNGHIGAFEEMTPEEFSSQFDVNFWGVINVTRAALPYLREQGAGHIIQMSAISGRVSVPGLSGDCAAKFAVEGFSEALAQEIKPFGIKLTLIEPGGFRTEWGNTSMGYAKPMECYSATVGAFREFVRDYAGRETGDPMKGAQAIKLITELPDPPLRLILGSDALTFARNSYKQFLAETEHWAHLSESTDHDDAQTNASTEIINKMKGS
jgi:NAD(P)-dependent dehydrogenase (short-subunit alcohol dehydrogenase family)